jgi:hypothetical protein
MPDGLLDQSFDPGSRLEDPSGNFGVVAPKAIVLQQDGKVIAGGAFGQFQFAGSLRTNLVRFQTNGAMDPGFSASVAVDIGFAGPEVDALAIQPDQKLVVGGLFTSVNGVLSKRVRQNWRRWFTRSSISLRRNEVGI